ncbi:MAG: hypothetical protein LBH70_11060 [Spirochaetaceae bacterium]|nr:hypothetical protein [Spirochaetaceae bacterium]
MPAPEGSRGVAVNKLKILDVLIEHLNQRKKQPTVDIESSPSESRIDALIEHYRSQIRQTKAVNMAMPYVSHAAIPTGVLFDLVA